MLQLQKYIGSEFSKYVCSLNKEIIKDEIKNLNSRENENVNLTCEKYDKDEFIVTAKWYFRISNFFYRFHNPTTIKGYIFLNKKNQTQVNLLLTPDTFIQSLFIVLPLFYILIFFSVESDRRDLKFCLLVSALFLLTPIILSLLSLYFKKCLKDRFIKYFRLEPII